MIVSGGGLVGCETALWLRNQGKTSDIGGKTKSNPTYQPELSYSSTETLKRLLPEKGIVVKTDTVISHATAAGVVSYNRKDETITPEQPIQ